LAGRIFAGLGVGRLPGSGTICSDAGGAAMRGNIFERIKGIWLPPEILSIEDITAPQKMLVALARNFPNGLRISNNDLADILGIDRRNVIYNIQKLRKKGYLLDTGPDTQHRVLKMNSDKLPLLSSDKTSPEQTRGSDTVITSGSDTSITSLAQSSDAHITHNKSNVNKSSNKGVYNITSDEIRLSQLLLDLILSRKPDFKRPNIQAWAKHIDRMIHFDLRAPERIEAVIRWCQNDTGNGNGWAGWQNNILSTATLKEKFDTLELKMQEQKNGRTKDNRGHNRQFAAATDALEI
jgi:DNA-binding Lrp family transcriptional regulator